MDCVLVIIVAFCDMVILFISPQKATVCFLVTNSSVRMVRDTESIGLLWKNALEES